VPADVARVTLVVLRGEDEQPVAQLAYEHAEYDRDRRRVLIDDGRFLALVPPAVVAFFLGPDDSIGMLLERDRALSAAWIEDGFLRAAGDAPSRTRCS
jgi:hypothetical protein